MKRKLLATLLSVTMLPAAALPAMATETVEAPSVTNLYTLDFEGADTSKAVYQHTDDESKAILKTWLPTGFLSDMTIANGGESWQYQVVSDAPSKTNDKVLKFVSTAKPSSGNKYIEMKSTGMTEDYPADDYEKISTGANGAAVISFDYYANQVTKADGTTEGRGQFIRAGRVLNEVDNEIKIEDVQDLIRINNDGTTRFFNVTTDYKVPIQDNKWHKFTFVHTSDNRYAVIVDGNVIIDFDENTVYNAKSFNFRGWRELRFYNNAALNSGTVERYMDNISYDIIRNVDFTAPAVSISHSDKDIDKYFSLNGSAERTIYSKASTKVSDFVNGLSVKEYNLTGGSAVVLDAQGNDITLDAEKTMADAAKVKVVTNTLGLIKEYPVVTQIFTEPTVEAVNSGTVITATGDDNDKLVVVNSRVEPVGGIGGKAADDYALKMIPTTTAQDETTGETTVSDTINTNGYLDYNIQKGSVVSEKANMPMTFEFSAYTEGGSNSVSDIEFVSKAGNSARVRMEFWSGNVNDIVASKKVATYKTSKWNRFAVSVYPNTMTYDLFINGEKVYTNEITDDKPLQYIQRIRLRTKYGNADDMILIDDVKLTYGAYDYTQKPAKLTDIGDKFEFGFDGVTLYPHKGILVSDVIAMANANGYTDARVYTDTTLTTLVENTDVFVRGNVLVISDGNGMYSDYRAIRKFSLDTESKETETGYTVTASGRYNTMEGSFEGMIIYVAEYDADSTKLKAVNLAYPSGENSQTLKVCLDVQSLDNVKAFIWDAKTMEPITASKKY